MTSQTGQQIIAVDILPDVSIGKGSQTIKFGQLSYLFGQYNTRNIFPEISNTKCGGEASPRPFIKNQN